MANHLTIGENVWMAPDADVVGTVEIGDRASVWYHAVIRGDEAPITIGAETNIQDGAVVHVDEGMPCIIGQGVTVGHNAIVHACKVGDNTLVGMGSILLSGCEIGKNCLIGAGSLVTGKMRCPDGQMIMGSPAKIIRPLNEKELASLIDSKENYLHLAKMNLEEA